jgi:hypothetical protein
VDAGAVASSMIFRSVETAAPEACCMRAMDCENGHSQAGQTVPV